MSFDRVAPFYRRLETLVFGRQLQEARVAFLRELKTPRRALVVGEGNGRFLAELRRAQPELPIECLDASARMLALARARVGDSFVQYLHADLRAAAFPPARYDLVVTHFFLDCFTEKSLQEVVEKLSASATADATWLIADFHEPPRGWRRACGRILMATMYRFFRVVAGIEASRLVDYTPFLRKVGFRLTSEAVFAHGLLRSQSWRRL
ncbi:MAG: class I SAM-dependent methyltransferase [Chthoniobacterales bacterium]